MKQHYGFIWIWPKKKFLLKILVGSDYIKYQTHIYQTSWAEYRKWLEMYILSICHCSLSSLSNEWEIVWGEEKTAATEETQNGKRDGQTIDLLSPTLHHLSEQGDAVQVDELLGEGDVPGCICQVLQGFQLGIHAGRLDPFMKLDRSLVLECRRKMHWCQRAKRHTYFMYMRDIKRHWDDKK